MEEVGEEVAAAALLGLVDLGLGWLGGRERKLALLVVTPRASSSRDAHRSECHHHGHRVMWERESQSESAIDGKWRELVGNQCTRERRAYPLVDVVTLSIGS